MKFHGNDVLTDIRRIMQILLPSLTPHAIGRKKQWYY